MNTMKSAMPKLLSGHHTRKTSFMVKKKKILSMMLIFT